MLTPHEIHITHSKKVQHIGGQRIKHNRWCIFKRLVIRVLPFHYNNVRMGAIVSQITSLTNCWLNPLFRCRSKKTSKLRVTGLCAGNSPVTGEFPVQMASNAENFSTWWRHHVSGILGWRYIQQIYHNVFMKIAYCTETIKATKLMNTVPAGVAFSMIENMRHSNSPRN